MTVEIQTPPRKHRWLECEEKRIPACDSPDGNDRTEKTCPHCGIVKITIHYPRGVETGREWRTKSGKPWTGRLTPPCL